jgi:hypothetical protein
MFRVGVAWYSRLGAQLQVPSGFEPFFVPPVLFGWEDVDGDGTPEIFDDTPYSSR